MTVEVELADSQNWVHASRLAVPLAARHLDRYLDASDPQAISDWRKKALVGNRACARIVLRRLRYRMSYNWGDSTSCSPRLQVWTTPLGKMWCNLFDDAMNGRESKNAMQYLPYYLLQANLANNELLRNYPTIKGITVGACTMDPNDWGDVNLEEDPIRVLEVTTLTGSTTSDVRAILNRADSRLELTSRYTDKTDPDHPLEVFISALTSLVADPVLAQTDVLLIHRGGGIQTAGKNANVSREECDRLVAALKPIHERGIEIVIALGHADAAILEPNRHRKEIGYFEATTPTAGAAWILKEHVNSRLVDDEAAYAQPDISA